MAAVVAGAEVVCETGAEGRRDGLVLGEGAVFAVCVVHGERLRGDVFGYPGGIARAAVVGAVQGGCSDGVGNGAREAILEDAGWVDGGSGGCSGSGEGFCGGCGSGAVEGADSLRRLRRLLLGTGALVVEEGSDSGSGGSTGCCNGSESGLGHGACLYSVGREKRRGKQTQRGNGEAKVGGHGATTCDYYFTYSVVLAGVNGFVFMPEKA